MKIETPGKHCSVKILYLFDILCAGQSATHGYCDCTSQDKSAFIATGFWLQIIFEKSLVMCVLFHGKTGTPF